MDRDDILRLVVTVFLEAKRLMIQAEEFSEDEFRILMTPNLEMKHAFDHFCRAEGVRLGIQDSRRIRSEDDDEHPAVEVAIDGVSDTPGEPGEDYVLKNYGKALGHVYRAYFDVADLYSMLIRSRITQAMRGYSRKTICEVVPTYYSRIRPEVDALSIRIAELRNGKDVVLTSQVMAEVSRYGQVLDRLRAAALDIESRIPALEDYEGRLAKERESEAAQQGRGTARSGLWALLAAMGGALAGALATWLLR